MSFFFDYQVSGSLEFCTIIVNESALRDRLSAKGATFQNSQRSEDKIGLVFFVEYYHFDTTSGFRNSDSIKNLFST